VCGAATLLCPPCRASLAAMAMSEEYLQERLSQEEDNYSASGFRIQRPQGRKYIGTEDHMQNDGVSMPRPAPHGHGRRHLTPEDHVDFSQAIDGAHMSFQPSRKLLIPTDHVKENVLKPVEEIQRVKVPSNDEMKDAVKDWLVTVHSMFVFDERKWEREVAVEPRGTMWVIEALTERKQSVSREGPSARIIAEKLAMCQVSQLRHFGLRFAGRNDRAVADAEYEAPAKPLARRANEGGYINRTNNPTNFSPGVSTALAGHEQGVQGGDTARILSNSRRHTENVMRRYIASGKDHFDSCAMPGPAAPVGSHGHSKGDDFDDTGLERGVGRGKRYIGTKDNLGDRPW